MSKGSPGSSGHGPAREIASAALAWLETDGYPRLMLALPSLELLWINQPARDLFTPQSGITAHARQLAFANPATGQAFAEFAARARHGITTHAVPIAGGKGHFLMRGSRIEIAGVAVCCIWLSRDMDDFVPIYADLDRIFGLTATENEIVLAMLDGHSAVEIATRRSVSIDTVRSQVRDIYAKVGVTTRERLFRRMQPFRIA